MPEEPEKKSLSGILKDILAGEGLEVAEDVAVATVRSVFKALPKIAEKIPGKIDDMAVQIILLTEPKILEMLDKIDGIDDPTY